jgi:protein-S-isoprenylcysteine O-methyltransferase Ste14
MSGLGTIDFGRWLFRWRSYTPIPILAILLAIILESRPTAFNPGDSAQLLIALGVVLALAGEALRFFTLGQVPEGTSGQGSSLEASALNTRGPYAYVRNPLYLGNLGICLGLLLVANRSWAYAIGLAFFVLQYFFIVRAEEGFLREKYGRQFDRYASLVPRWIPRLTPAYPGRLREGFDLGRALKKEHNPFAVWASGLLLLVGWNLYGAGSLTVARLALLISIEAVVLAGFVIIKAYKRGWLKAL